MQTVQETCVLFEIFQHWDSEGSGHLVCIRQQTKVDRLQESMHSLREQLSQMELRESVPPLIAPVIDINRNRSPILPSKRTSGIHSLANDLRSASGTIEDLLRVMTPDLLEIGRGEMAGIIMEQVETIRKIADELKTMQRP